MFYMMFECILNLLAEITNFGDREFYEDWWNCTTWDEFARKWNKPVHEFLLCHVYLRAYVFTKVRLNGQSSSHFFDTEIKTNCLCAHVFVFRSTSRSIPRCHPRIRAILHVCIDDVADSSDHNLKVSQGEQHWWSAYIDFQNTTFGNFYFWTGLIVGVPLLASAYGREWARRLEE